MPITKATEDADGNLYVEGLATNDVLDLDDQIIDRDFARKGLQTWFTDWANVRQMHSTSLAPAGKAVEFEERPEGFWVKTLVVEPSAKELVKAGVYQAYSVGVSRARVIRDQVAKNGRVVDGVFSEISLVDFPANPTTKFMIAKRAGEQAPVEVVEKTITPQVTKTAGEPDGEAEVSVKPSDLVEMLRKLGKTPEVAKGELSTEERGNLDASDFAYVDSEGGRHLPIHDEDHVRSALGRFGQTQFESDSARKAAARKVLAKAKELGIDVDEDSTVAQAAKTATPEVTKAGGRDCTNCDAKYHADHKGNFCSECGHKLPAAGDNAEKGMASHDAQPHLAAHREPDGDEDGPDVDNDGDARKRAPYHLLRLHDGLCAAFHDVDVLAEHPALAKGIGEVVEPGTFGAAVTAALAADGGTGARAGELPALSEAYGLAVSLKAADPELLDQALADLRKAFQAAYPDARPSPADMQPGKFQRPYVGAGRAPLSARPGQKPRIPLSSHVPDPGQFQRPLLTDGRESAAPGSNPVPRPKAGEAELTKGRTYYTNAAKEQASGLMTAMHDYIAEQHPGVCPMVGVPYDGEPAVPNSAGSTLTTATAVTTPGPDMRAGAVPTPVDPAAAAGLTKTTTPGPVLDPDVLSHLVADAIRDQLTPVTETLADLGKRLGDLEAAPDPAAAPPRNATSITRRREREQAPVDEGDSEKVEHLVRLVKAARDRDSTVARPAMDKLLTAVGPTLAAQLLS